MKLFRIVLGATSVALMLSGCSSLPVLDEPNPIPMSVSSYKAHELQGKSDQVSVALDVADCVEAAMLVSKGVFGGTSVEAAYPVRQAIEREFQRVIDDNFCEPVDGKDDLILRVSTMRVMLTQTRFTYTSDISLTVRLMHPDESRAPLFRKTYRAKSSGSMDDDDEIPNCFYEALQSIAENVATDLASNKKLVWYFEGVQNNKN